MDYCKEYFRILDEHGHDPASDFWFNHQGQLTTPMLQKYWQTNIRDRYKIYRYLVTFTYDPIKFPDPPIQKIEDYIKMQPNRKALTVKTASYVQETHKDGRPHWHLHLTTNRPLRSDAFKQYQNNYGRIDISRSKDTNSQWGDFYIAKENEPKLLK